MLRRTRDAQAQLQPACCSARQCQSRGRQLLPVCLHLGGMQRDVVLPAALHARQDPGACLLQVLGTALGTALALEQAVYSGNLDISKGRQLQELCTAATSVIELAGARVQVTPQNA